MYSDSSSGSDVFLCREVAPNPVGNTDDESCLESVIPHQITSVFLFNRCCSKYGREAEVSRGHPEKTTGSSGEDQCSSHTIQVI